MVTGAIPATSAAMFSIEWTDPVKELVGFAGLFLSAGAIGFRYFAIRNWGGAPESDQPFYDDASRRAGVLGLIGVALSVVMAGFDVVGLADRRKLGVMAIATTDASSIMEI